MKLEDQVCSMEKGSKLLRLGVSRENALYAWAGDKYFYRVIYSSDVKAREAEYNFFYVSPAFTVTELLEMLPNDIGDRILTLIPPTEGTEYNWCAAYIELGKSIQDDCDNYCDGSSPASALASLLIHLLENKRTDIKGVNEQLKNS